MSSQNPFDQKRERKNLVFQIKIDNIVMINGAGTDLINPFLSILYIRLLNDFKYFRRHDTQHNDTQDNDTQNIKLTCDTQHKCYSAQMLLSTNAAQHK